MPDYKELYYTLLRETEKALRLLIEAQQDCEDRILYDKEPPES